MSEVNGFNPLLYLLYVDDVALNMLGDGDIGVTKASDTVTEKEGLYGDVMLAISPSRLYTVTFRLQASSRDNRRLCAYHDAMQQGGNGFFRVRIVDVNGDTRARFSSMKAWVKRLPDLKRSKEALDIEWTVGAANGNLVHEGAA